MDLRIAVDLGGRGEQEPGPLRLREPERVERPQGADLQGMDRVLEVVARRCRRGEMEDPVDPAVHVEVVRDVVALVAEPLVGQRADEVVRVAGEQGVEAEDLPALGQEPLAEMGPEEARAAGHDRSRHLSGSRRPRVPCRSR